MPDKNERQLTFAWASETQDSPSAGKETPGASPRLAALADRMHKLASRGVFIGTSSWKYPGWRGTLYASSRYETRGRFSQRRFNDECLGEYAGVFPTVCGDFAFYQFPTAEAWQRTFAQLPEGFQFSLKIPEEITVERFPDLPRYGKRAGTENGHFMDAAVLRKQLLDQLDPYRDRLGVLVFQFGTFHAGPMRQPDAFARRLARMLSSLPLDRFRFAVEVRNTAFLESPGREHYLACLREHGVAHCLNSWTRMPAIAEQMRIAGIFTASFVAARFLLRPGRTYEQAVEQFAPYEHIQEPYPQGQQALHDLIEQCLNERRSLYAFVNNRFEGNAIDTIDLATANR